MRLCLALVLVIVQQMVLSSGRAVHKPQDVHDHSVETSHSDAAATHSRDISALLLPILSPDHGLPHARDHKKPDTPNSTPLALILASDIPSKTSRKKKLRAHSAILIADTSGTHVANNFKKQVSKDNDHDLDGHIAGDSDVDPDDEFRLNKLLSQLSKKHKQLVTFIKNDKTGEKSQQKHKPDTEDELRDSEKEEHSAEKSLLQSIEKEVSSSTELESSFVSLDQDNESSITTEEDSSLENSSLIDLDQSNYLSNEDYSKQSEETDRDKDENFEAFFEEIIKMIGSGEINVKSTEIRNDAARADEFGGSTDFPVQQSTETFSEETENDTDKDVEINFKEDDAEMENSSTGSELDDDYPDNPEEVVYSMYSKENVSGEYLSDKSSSAEQSAPFDGYLPEEEATDTDYVGESPEHGESSTSAQKSSELPGENQQDESDFVVEVPYVSEDSNDDVDYVEARNAAESDSNTSPEQHSEEQHSETTPEPAEDPAGLANRNFKQKHVHLHRFPQGAVHKTYKLTFQFSR